MDRNKRIKITQSLFVGGGELPPCSAALGRYSITSLHRDFMQQTLFTEMRYLLELKDDLCLGSYREANSIFWKL